MADHVAEAEEDAADERQFEEDAEEGAHAEAELGSVVGEGFFFVDGGVSHSFSFGSMGRGAAPGAKLTVLLKRVSNSSGSGKTMVVFFSTPISESVWR